MSARRGRRSRGSAEQNERPGWFSAAGSSSARSRTASPRNHRAWMLGGIWFLWILNYGWSVAVAIGFIALVGVAAETGVVMLIYLDQAWHLRTRNGRRPATADIAEAVEEGAVERVRPKMMTVVAIIAGLLPILWSAGTGASVMKRIAAPMVGGMVSSAVLTLVVIPAVYALWREWELGRQPEGTPSRLPVAAVGSLEK